MTSHVCFCFSQGVLHALLGVHACALHALCGGMPETHREVLSVVGTTMTPFCLSCRTQQGPLWQIT